MKKIAIYGGAFDPPHIGHEKVVRYVLDNTSVSEVLIMPSGAHRTKQQISTSFEHRMKMSELAFGKISGTKLSTLDTNSSDLEEKGKGSTWNLIQKIGEHLGYDVQLYFIMGQDNAESIESWYNWKQLIEDVHFIVLPRDEFASQGKWYTKSPHLFLEGFSLQDVSSSELRKGLKKDYVSDDVQQYFEVNNLYPGQ